MKYEDSYNTLVKMISSSENIKHGKGAEPSEIDDLLHKFPFLPDDFAWYLRDYGWIELGAFEIYGLGPDVPAHLDLLLRSERQWAGMEGWLLPRDCLGFLESGGEWIYAIRLAPQTQAIKIVRVVYDLEEGWSSVEDTEYRIWANFICDLLLESG